MRVIVLQNPTAGDADQDPRAIVSVLEQAGHEVEWQSTKEDGWEAALDRRADLFAVAGGDGTVQKVFTRLIGRDALTTLLPLGSANNIARSLGFDDEDDDLERLVRAWPTATRVACDVGSVSSGEAECRFVESAGGGLFAEVLVRADDVDDGDVTADEKLERGLRLVRASLAAARPARWELTLDGTDLSAELIGLEVLNVRDLGPRITLAPEADPGDGLLDVVLIRAEDANALAADGQPAFDVCRAREIALRPPRDTPLHCDDDVLEAGAVTVRLAGGVQVLVPRLG